MTLRDIGDPPLLAPAGDVIAENKAARAIAVGRR